MSTQWNLPDGLPPLEDNEVQVWRIEPSSISGLTDHLPSLLSQEEEVHANRLRSGQVRDHFTIGRACLRVLLGNTLNAEPKHISITKGVHGKPGISAAGKADIQFNLTHSKDTILIALGRQGAVGVDVEYVDRATNVMEIAEANFTETESRSLAAIADSVAQLRVFYHYWTRKEAILKADGRGLLLPLASFDVSFESMSAQPVRVDEPTGEEGQLYFVSDLDVGDRAVAALALESSACRINTMIFPIWLYRAAEAEP